MIRIKLINKLQDFIEQEARSCSMDFGCITPEYVYKMRRGQFSIDDIECGLAEIRKQGIDRWPVLTYLG